uniref:Uncharacterized protein n=1 Tax=Anguilla anguilla TaxID=7936 RepID=A0A0E9V373_ANGAN
MWGIQPKRQIWMETCHCQYAVQCLH